MKALLDIIIKCNSPCHRKDINFRGKTKRLEKYLQVFLLYVIEMMNINGMKLECKDIEKQVYAFGKLRVDGIFVDNISDKPWYVELKVSDERYCEEDRNIEESKEKVNKSMEKYRDNYNGKAEVNLLIICFSVSSRKCVYRIKNFIKDNYEDIGKSNHVGVYVMETDWMKILIDNERSFVSEFIYRDKIKQFIMKSEAFFTLMVSRNYYSIIQTNKNLNGCISEGDSSKRLKYVGIEVNYQVGHKSCIKSLCRQRGICLDHNESRQADICLIYENNHISLFEVKMTNSKETTQIEVYRKYINSLNDKLLEIECYCDDDIILCLKPYYKDHCRCKDSIKSSSKNENITTGNFYLIEQALQLTKSVMQLKSSCTDIHSFSNNFMVGRFKKTGDDRLEYDI